MRRTLLLLALGSLAAVTVGATTVIPTFPVKLSPRDTALVTTAACSGVGITVAEHIRAYTETEGSSSISVEVHCKSHAKIGAFPVLRYSSCANAKGKWRCDAGNDAIHMTLPDSRVLPVVTDGVTLQLAIEIITEATKLQVPPFHTPATQFMQGQCWVSPVLASPSPEMKLFSISCGYTSLELTKHCWDKQKHCRYFISDSRGYP